MAFFPQWNDDECMEALFSSSAVFDDKMLHTWKPAVHWTVRGRSTDSSNSSTLKPSLLIHPESLARRFARKGVEPVPLVLNHVLSSMIQDKELMHLDEFHAMCEHVSLSRWLFRTAVVTPARWGIHSLQSLWSEDSPSSSSRSIPPGPYLSMHALKSIASAIAHFATSELEPTERIFCLSQGEHATCGPRLSCSFHALCLRVGASDEASMSSILKDLPPAELHWIAKYLVWSKQAVVRGDLLKIHKRDVGPGPVEVTAGDESLVVLQHMIATVEVSMTKLQEKMDETKAKAVQRKRANKTADAVMYLRHFKALGDSLAQRQAGLLNLLQTEHQLRDMHVQALVVDGYKVATAGLRHVRDSLGLTADAVDDAVAEWQAVADEATQVEALLSSTGQGVEFDEDALLAELESLNGDVVPETKPELPAPITVEIAAPDVLPPAPLPDDAVTALETRVAQLNMSK